MCRPTAGCLGHLAGRPTAVARLAGRTLRREPSAPAGRIRAGAWRAGRYCRGLPQMGRGTVRALGGLADTPVAVTPSLPAESVSARGSRPGRAIASHHAHRPAARRRLRLPDLPAGPADAPGRRAARPRGGPARPGPAPSGGGRAGGGEPGLLHAPGARPHPGCLRLRPQRPGPGPAPGRRRARLPVRPGPRGPGHPGAPGSGALPAGGPGPRRGPGAGDHRRAGHYWREPPGTCPVRRRVPGVPRPDPEPGPLRLHRVGRPGVLRGGAGTGPR